jgi:predicted amidophosphoribosyltransferase
VRGAFGVPAGLEDRVFGRRLVLVDDVYTTGATVSAATAALKKAGALDVTVLTFARALAGPI